MKPLRLEGADGAVEGEREQRVEVVRARRSDLHPPCTADPEQDEHGRAATGEGGSQAGLLGRAWRSGVLTTS